MPSYAYSRKRKTKTTRRSPYTKKRPFKRNVRLARGWIRKKRPWQTVETKLLALNRQNNLLPGPIHAGSKCFYKAFVIGTKPASWTGTYTNLGGVEIPKVSATTPANQTVRDGNYVYMKKTHISLNIDMMNTGGTNQPPTQFRVVVAKSKRGNTPAGYTIDPTTSLFLNEGGTHFGHSSASADGTDIMLQPLNKRDFFIKSDRKMIMSMPMDSAVAGYTGKYACTADRFYNLGYYKKTRYEDSGTFADLPSDLDTNYFIIVYARSIEKAQSANDWEVNLRGTTTFSDI